jgi:predicted amidohydrolase
MRIALAQVLSTADPQRNLVTVRDYARQAKEAGASLVVFPEAMQVSFAHDISKYAQPLDGPWATLLRQQAREIGITIAAGMFTPGVDQRVRNTLLVAGSQVDTHYDKIHLYDAFGYLESDSVTPGDAPVQFEHEGASIGLATCYDLRFPQLFVHHAKAGASVCIVHAGPGPRPGLDDVRAGGRPGGSRKRGTQDQRCRAAGRGALHRSGSAGPGHCPGWHAARVAGG